LVLERLPAPSLLLKTPQERTLVQFQYNFKGEYATQYPLVFACR
jgi:hypothetical protein